MRLQRSPVARRRLGLVAILATVFATVAACSTGGASTPTPVPSPTAPAAVAASTSVAPVSAASPAASPATVASGAAASPAAVTALGILARASQQLAQTQSVHFKLTIAGTTYIDDAKTIQLTGAEGNVVRPDKVQTSFQAKIQGMAISSIKLISVGAQSWMTDLVTGKWGPALSDLGYNPTILFDDQQGLGPVMTQVQQPQLLADATIDGHAMYHIIGMVANAVISPVTSATMGGNLVGVEVWIDQQTLTLRRAIITEQPDSDNPDPATWTVDLTQYNRDVTIEPPPLGK